MFPARWGELETSSSSTTLIVQYSCATHMTTLGMSMQPIVPAKNRMRHGLQQWQSARTSPLDQDLGGRVAGQ
jgi:hypothetical protein